jgi:SHS2 domain-containing protein
MVAGAYVDDVYETFEHTADIGVRAMAPTLGELFAEAAAGLFSIISDEAPPAATGPRRTFSISGSDLTYLLFDWLAELLFIFDTGHLVLFDFDVQITDHGLEATAATYPIPPAHVAREVKAITYHRLAVDEREDGWHTEFIVDI